MLKMYRCCLFQNIYEATIHLSSFSTQQKYCPPRFEGIISYSLHIFNVTCTNLSE